MARTDRNNVTGYWWDSHIPGLSLMSADFTSHDYATHTHDAFVIAVSEFGDGGNRRILRSERPHATFQELLRHHAYAICQCRQTRPELPTS
jgi:hypothetical protein